MGRKIFFTFLFLFLSVKITHANQILVSATVPVSDLWVKTITENSIISYEENKNQYLVIIRGFNKERLVNHKVKATFYTKNTKQTVIKNSPASFEVGQQTRLTSFEDVSWERKIELGYYFPLIQNVLISDVSPKGSPLFPLYY